MHIVGFRVTLKTGKCQQVMGCHCQMSMYIVHTVQPILFKYLPSVRQNTTTSRIKDVH